MVELQALHEVAQAGIESTRVDQLVVRVAKILGERLYVGSVGIGFYDEAAGTLTFHHAARNCIDIMELSLPIEQGIAGWVARNHLPRRLGDVRLDPDYLASNPHTLSELCVPILIGETLAGIINAESPHLNAFGVADERLLTIVAGELGMAVERTRLLEETRRQVERLVALREIDQAILSTLDLEETLQVWLEKTTGLLHLDAANFLLYEPRLHTLRMAAERGLPSTPVWDSRLPLTDTHAGRVALSRELEFIPDLNQSEDGLTRRIRLIGESFVSFIALPLVAKGELKGVLQLFHRTRLEPTRDWMDFLQALAGQAAIAIDNAQLFQTQEQANRRLTKAYEETIDGWSRALDLRDHETKGHSHRVTDLTLRLARRLGIPEERFAHMRRGAQLHDIGKMGIPDRILRQPGPLTQAEWEIMLRHPLLALDLLFPIDFLQLALEIPGYHHEKWDGTGYPQGLKGESIPLAARIFAVADVWDALISNRPYRLAWPHEKALAYIQEQSGRHFDPRVVDAFLQLLEEQGE
jgi:HD-GYP domain-containing protein (c-di-GMP phosphodiesterase class II)/putative methionine-R-sulfoxide reductase with GAF domain